MTEAKFITKPIESGEINFSIFVDGKTVISCNIPQEHFEPMLKHLLNGQHKESKVSIEFEKLEKLND